jgi:UDP-N-acetylglucosamine:LPS N-acetylglucosamine transferase
MLEQGVSEYRLKFFGFPTRYIFNHVNTENIDIPLAFTLEKSSVNFLIMNGSQGGNNLRKIAEKLLKNFDCNVTILAGRDIKLKKSLEGYLMPRYGERITVCGFTDKVEYYMMKSDILLVRASPNVPVEAVNLCKPVIVTGSFTGQEEKNPLFVRNNNLGIECRNINKLPQVVNEIFANDGQKLKKIQKGQLEFRNPDAASDIVKFIADLL